MQQGPVLVTEPTHDSAIKLLEDFFYQNKNMEKKRKLLYLQGVGVSGKKAKSAPGPMQCWRDKDLHLYSLSVCFDKICLVTVSFKLFFDNFIRSISVERILLTNFCL